MPLTRRLMMTLAAQAAVGTVLLNNSLASAATGEPAGPRKFAVVSLLGDSIELVTHRAGTGTHLDRNFHETLPMAGFLDKTALLAVSDALKKAVPTAGVSLVTVAAVEPGSPPAAAIDDDRFLPGESLSATLKQEGATHLLLVTRYRAEAGLNAEHAKLGSGPLEGVGFYIDRSQRLKRHDTGEVGVGFLAPYAYFKVLLVDVATSTVLRREIVKASTTLSSARSEQGNDPWGTLTAEQKADLLRKMVRRHVLQAVPLLVGAAS